MRTVNPKERNYCFKKVEECECQFSRYSKVRCLINQIWIIENYKKVGENKTN